MTKNSSEFQKHPRLPDMCDLLILSVYPTIRCMEDIHITLTISLYVLRIGQAPRCKLLCFSKTETYQVTCLIACLMHLDPSLPGLRYVRTLRRRRKPAYHFRL